jgi:hypothetical protein
MNLLAAESTDFFFANHGLFSSLTFVYYFFLRELCLSTMILEHRHTSTGVIFLNNYLKNTYLTFLLCSNEFKYNIAILLGCLHKTMSDRESFYVQVQLFLLAY